MAQADLVLELANGPLTPFGSDLWIDIFMRMGVAFLLGSVVSLLYQYSRPADERNPGLPSTLVLLAMLIAMVTLAVGQNIAVAFTLVGTLAIVRFRTPVRDTRDTAYVIFSVAVGISVGQWNMVVATAGTVALAVAIFIIREGSRPSPPASPPEEQALLRLEISPPDDDAGVYEGVIQGLGGTCRVERSNIDRERDTLQLSLQVLGVPPEQSTKLVTSLLENPSVRSAQLTQKDRS